MARYRPKHSARRSRRLRRSEPAWRVDERRAPSRRSGVTRHRRTLTGLAALGLAGASFAGIGHIRSWLGGTSHPQQAAAAGSKARRGPGRARAGAGESPARASLASALGFAPAAPASWVTEENSLPGTTAWKLTNPASYHQIEGFASSVSIQAGDPLDLYVSTTAATFGIQAFRMGYYGGALGHLVWSAGPLQGVRQPVCPVVQPLRMVSCSWSNPVAVPTSGWVQGDYLFKLTASTGWQSYVPLTVRDDASHSAYLVNNSVATWQAYNIFGGYDLYSGPLGPGRAGLAGRSYAVSFDRPYVLGDGAGDFVSLELPMVAMMESLGLNVSYTTDVDVSERPGTLLQHRTFITLGHDEYWTLSMLDGVTAARDAGVNLVVLGANTAYRHIRLEPSPLGPDRVEVDYKDPNKDPLLGKDNPDVTPWAWRDWPNDRPESLLLGEMWQCNPVQADMVITDPSAWLFAGTGLQRGSRIPGIIGPEYDSFSPYAPNPGDVTVLARSPVRCDGKAEEADMTYYSAPSGAGVWDTGTIEWVGGLHPYCTGCSSPGPVTRITTNVLAAFGAGPAGFAHPSSANVLPGGRVPTTTTPPAPAESR